MGVFNRNITLKDLSDLQAYHYGVEYGKLGYFRILPKYLVARIDLGRFEDWTEEPDILKLEIPDPEKEIFLMADPNTKYREIWIDSMELTIYDIWAGIEGMIRIKNTGCNPIFIRKHLLDRVELEGIFKII